MSPHATRAYSALQRVLLALLAVNCSLYALHGTAGEAVDSFAWFVLLVLFYSETSAQAGTRGELLAVSIRYARLGAAAAVVIATRAYADEAAWLDAANSALWIAVVLLLEAQVRYPAYALERRTGFTVIAAVLYGALGVLPLAWLMRGEWLSAYDAALWLAAFATIEKDVWSAGKAWATTTTRKPRETRP